MIFYICNCSGATNYAEIDTRNAQNGRERHDSSLTSESDRTVTSEDNGALATTEGEQSSEMVHHRVNDTDELK